MLGFFVWKSKKRHLIYIVWVQGDISDHNDTIIAFPTQSILFANSYVCYITLKELKSPNLVWNKGEMELSCFNYKDLTLLNLWVLIIWTWCFSSFVLSTCTCIKYAEYAFILVHVIQLAVQLYVKMADSVYLPTSVCVERAGPGRTVRLVSTCSVLYHLL